MLRKLLFGTLITLLLLAAVAVFVYFRYLRHVPPPISKEDRARLVIVPLPSSLQLKDGYFEITRSFTQELIGTQKDPRLVYGLKRFFNRLSDQTQLRVFIHGTTEFSIECDSASTPIQQAVENESYDLEVNAYGIKLKAATVYGALHGLETVLQLIQQRNGKYAIPYLTLHDSPRFPWRGLMIDVCRHWITKETILRNIDCMAAVKMNVLHLHLSEHQAFRVESKVFPKLHQLGSDGLFYSQKDIREIVRYARDRGVRIVPEFDMPGHTASWLVAYPQLGSAPGPHHLEEKFGISTPVMDPTREEVYAFINTFVGEMVSLFPDPYFHIGGDEVNPADWNKNPAIRSFMKEKGMKDYRDLQNYFNKRIQGVLTKHHRKMVGWDEIIHPDLDKNIVVQAWRGQKALFNAVRQGDQSILSAGYYLDYKLPAGQHYLVDPEVLPGAITIKPDFQHWSQWDLTLKVSDSEMPLQLTLFGTAENLRGLFSLNGTNTAFETAELKGQELKFVFQSDYGKINVEGKIEKDSIRGTMLLGLLSFHFKGTKVGGQDMAGTKPPKVELFKPLSADESKRILGGEAAMWTELVTDKNLDTRIWPRTAAIAEKLWSPKVLTQDVEDMYRRIVVLTQYINTIGIHTQAIYESMIAELASGKSSAPVKILLDMTEEVKRYDRLLIYKNLTTHTPLNEVADAAQPESMRARTFSKQVEELIRDPERKAHDLEVRSVLQELLNNHDAFAKTADSNLRLRKIIPLSEQAKKLSETALSCLELYQHRKKLTTEEYKKVVSVLHEAEQPKEGIFIAIVPALQQLVNAVKP